MQMLTKQMRQKIDCCGKEFHNPMQCILQQSEAVTGSVTGN